MTRKGKVLLTRSMEQGDFFYPDEEEPEICCELCGTTKYLTFHAGAVVCCRCYRELHEPEEIPA